MSPRRRLSDLTGATVPGADPRIPYDQTDPTVQTPAPQQQGAPAPGMPGVPPQQPQGPGAAGQGPDLGSITQGPQGFDLGAMAQQSPPGIAGTPGLGPDISGGQNQTDFTTDQLTGADLSAMGGDLNAEDLQAQDMQAALMDPNTPPQERQMIQQQIAMAARRKMAGMGGGGGFGGGLGA